MYKFGNLHVNPTLYEFVETELLPKLPLDKQTFWTGLENIIAKFTPQNDQLLYERDALQAKLDTWYKSHANSSIQDQRNFLESIDYLLPPLPFEPIQTRGLDPEITSIAAPQLVCPGDNARYALNAVNARWGSLLDAYYGTDLISNEGELAKNKEYNPKRGLAVFEKVYQFLDNYFPLENGTYNQAIGFLLKEEALHVKLDSGATTTLKDSSSFIAIDGTAQAPSQILLRHHGLHVILHIDANHPIGKTHKANIADVKIEAALSVIQDFEDSVAAVDGEDKTKLYRNWLGLMRGDLMASFESHGRTINRSLAQDKVFRTAKGLPCNIKTRAIMLVRNVGMHMKSDAITYHGQPIYEGMLDAYVCAVAGMYDLTRHANSATGSIYIVKPKCHGPKEIAFVDTLFSEIENSLGLGQYTIKLGIMDEERRTTLNLAHCIKAAKNRIFFINTGFLDRTGDEIHSIMHSGPVLDKNGFKSAPWLEAYEAQNVAVGLGMGFYKKAQIGKGMWTMTERMNAMVANKLIHVQSGASTAWVPSPVAATLHALHYHQVNVHKTQEHFAKKVDEDYIPKLLTLPLLDESFSKEEILTHLDDAIQSILGYVVRWVGQGIGCSKVLDASNEALMEDRATLRIGSQLLVNWLHHGLIHPSDVHASCTKMARVVDEQNSDNSNYRSLLLVDSLAMRAAKELIFDGIRQPNGYTEFILHHYRKEAKKRVLK
jgi:malate synthase